MIKYFFPIALLLFILSGCSREEKSKLEAFNPEVFAFDIGDQYEVNATVRVKGFKEQHKGEEFTGSVAYDLDLIKPDGSVTKSLISKIEDLKFSEEVKDAGIDIQFNLDSTYPTGKYKIIFNLKDTYSNSTASTSAEFQLSK